MQPSPVNLGTFPSLRQETPCPLPQPLATTNLLSVSMDLCVLDFLCKWNDTRCGLLCLASLTRHDVFKVHPHCRVCQCFIPFIKIVVKYTGHKIYHLHPFCTYSSAALSTSTMLGLCVVSFLRLNNTPFCGSAPFHISIHPSRDVWVVSAFWPLWVSLSRTYAPGSLCGCGSSPLSVYQGTEVLGRRVTPRFTVRGLFMSHKDGCELNGQGP